MNLLKRLAIVTAYLQEIALHLTHTPPNVAVFMSTTLSRPNKVGLICPSVRPSTKSFFDFNEIWYVGRAP